MEHQIHQAEAMCVWDQFHTDKGTVSLEEGLRLAQLIEIVSSFLDVVIGGDKESAGAGGRVLHNLAWLRFDQAHDAIDQGAWREILPCPGLFFRSVLFQQAFIEVAEPLFARREPVELVNGVGERLQVGWLAQLGLSIGEDGQDERVFGFGGVAEIKQKLADVGK